MNPNSPSSHVPSPYDADAALASLRPRLHAVRARQRRLMGGSAMAVTLLLGSVGVAVVQQPGSSDTSTVLAGAPGSFDGLDGVDDIDGASGGDTAGAGAADGSGSGAGTSTPSADPGAPTPPLDGPAAAELPPAPAATPPAPAPPAPAPAPAPGPAPAPSGQLHTFHYDGAGTLVVEQRGTTLTMVSATPQPGWSATPRSGSDYVKVEFRKDNVSRWLKVRLHDGIPVAERWEEIRPTGPVCSPPQGTTTHAAPSGAGSVTVTVNSSGALQLGSVTPAAGWAPDIRHVRADSIKVKFWNDALRKGVWIEICITNCAVTTQTGYF